MRRQKRYFITLVLGCMLNITPVYANDENPLRPVDTSSPRTTLADFQNILNDAYASLNHLRQDYFHSERLYPTPQEKIIFRNMFKQVEVASRSLDLSALPSALGQETAMLLTLQLKSILDRIDIPPILLVPDAVMMKGKDHKRWTIPNTSHNTGKDQPIISPGAA